jgi:hypothetical protein
VIFSLGTVIVNIPARPKGREEDNINRNLEESRRDSVNRFTTGTAGEPLPWTFPLFVSQGLRSISFVILPQ